ncbi:hypothetical protein GCM10018775_49310 [Streptomyces umbrinus]|nr:hypothetical protein GCM10018775_49310 [Streptomyces umbrinus]
MAEIRADLGGEIPASGTSQGPQIEIDIHTGGGACPGPVPGMATGGRCLDHGGRHGELSHARLEGKAEILVRGVSEHQHSPCADGTPIL